MGSEATSPDSEHRIYKPNFDHYTPVGQGGFIDFIPDGALVPVGGSGSSGDMTEITLKADLGAFTEFITQIRTDATEYDLTQFEKLIKIIGLVDEITSFPPVVYAHLLSFTRKMAECYPVNRELLGKRDDQYKEGASEFVLSQVVTDGFAACVEYATLAQGYLQEVNIPSTWFSGDFLQSRDREFSQKHTFIVLGIGGNTIVYDPARPIISTNGVYYPRLLRLQGDFLEAMKTSSGKRFVAAQDIYAKLEVLYGISNGKNIIPERDIY